MIFEHGWRYYFSQDHPTCKRCGRPDLKTLCYCVNESHLKAAVMRADFDEQRKQLVELAKDD